MEMKKTLAPSPASTGRKHLLALAFGIVTMGCASAGQPTPPPAAAAQVQPAAEGLARYAGTYALQAPSRTINLRVWVGDDARLHGELVGLGEQTTLRPGGEHRFLHADSDDIWVLFTVEDGRATGATMHQRGREISGARVR
jgi:hypothetical protein